MENLPYLVQLEKGPFAFNKEGDADTFRAVIFQIDAETGALSVADICESSPNADAAFNYILVNYQNCVAYVPTAIISRFPQARKFINSWGLEPTGTLQEACELVLANSEPVREAGADEALDLLEIAASALVGIRDDLSEVGGFDQPAFNALNVLEAAVTARITELSNEVKLNFSAIFQAAGKDDTSYRTFAAARWSEALHLANEWSASQEDETWVLRGITLID